MIEGVCRIHNDVEIQLAVRAKRARGGTVETQLAGSGNRVSAGISPLSGERSSEGRRVQVRARVAATGTAADFFVNPPLTLISGASSPIENMPQMFQKLSYFDPLRYLVTIIRGVTIGNAPFSALWPNLAALAAFSLILFSISAWRFRKQ